MNGKTGWGNKNLSKVEYVWQRGGCPEKRGQAVNSLQTMTTVWVICINEF